MGMKLEYVGLEQLRPNPANMRKKFEGIAELAEKLSITDGPVTPLVVIPDGEKYLIVDGERRYKAMEKLESEQRAVGLAPVLVCAGWDDASVAIAMLATDDKQKLSDEERQAGIQTCMALGLFDEDIAILGGLDAKQVRAAKNGRWIHQGANVGRDEPVQASLDQLIWLGEHCMGYTSDELAKVVEAGDRWQPVAMQVEASHKRQADAERLADELRKDGRRVVTSEADVSGLTRVAGWYPPEDFHPCGKCVALVEVPTYGTKAYASWWCADPEHHGWKSREDEDAEREAKSREADRIAAIRFEGAKARREAVGAICDQPIMDQLLETFAKWAVPEMARDYWWIDLDTDSLEADWLLPMFAVEWMEGKLKRLTSSGDVAKACELWEDWVEAVDAATGYRCAPTLEEARLYLEPEEAERRYGDE